MDALQIASILGLQNMRIDGEELWASCPNASLHPGSHKNGDKHPSWSINTRTLKHHCFGCGFEGSLVSLVQQIKNVTYAQAMKEVYSDLSTVDLMQMMESNVYEPSNIKPAMSFEYGNLLLTDAHMDAWEQTKTPYWEKRRVTDQTIKKWRMGFSPEMNRATIPVDYKGERVGFTARALTNDVLPKWFHYPGMPRRHILFGLDNAGYSNAPCVLCEAPFSAVMLDQWDVPNPISSFGAVLGEAQARLIRNNFDDVVIFYDPDEGGRIGTIQAIQLLEPFCASVRIVPEQRGDPADLTADEIYEALFDKPLINSWEYKYEYKGR